MRFSKDSFVKNPIITVLGAGLLIVCLITCIQWVSGEIREEREIVALENDANKKLEKVGYGMSEDEVVSVLGKVHSSTQYEIDEKLYKILTYAIEEKSTYHLRIILVDGRVDSKELVHS
ncbi:hypothetical protein EXIGUO8H_20377 [Exiguobacterium sp. 8H]|uniref:hypothetical protein n=1 Tax=unclassified Exiguobacterium TaxID=2644629 RepID=UPI0012F446AC|nr:MULTISPECIES: hypothetical protein [unclassified Exiguobacterium]VXB53156.1 hypothetical protein EXIGUO8A_11446 [Exiguobacterium sp. 8A]VXB53716.1 hypothetical protein EXIGUO8H_20377 [Exiguobacterium sp. 8H]